MRVVPCAVELDQTTTSKSPLGDRAPPSDDALWSAAVASSRTALRSIRGQCEDSAKGSIVEPEGTGLLLVQLVSLLPGADKAFDIDMRSIATQSVPPLSRARVNIEATRLQGCDLRERIPGREFAGQPHELEAQLSRTPRVPVGDFDVDPICRSTVFPGDRDFPEGQAGDVQCIEFF